MSQSGNTIGLRSTSGQHDHRSGASLAKLAKDLESVEHRQHDVQDDEIEASHRWLDPNRRARRARCDPKPCCLKYSVISEQSSVSSSITRMIREARSGFNGGMAGSTLFCISNRTAHIAIFTKLKVRPARFDVYWELMKQFAIFLLAGTLAAQSPTAKSFVGTVAGFHPDSAEVEIRPDQGEKVLARFTPDTIAQKTAPGARDLKSAETIKATDVAIGDRVLITLEPGTPEIRRIVVMPAGDIAKHNEADRLDWQKRGVAGIVSAKSANRITVKSGTMTGEAESIVTVDDHTAFKHYAPDSVRFADAKPSKLADVAVGDQLRARGEKSEDGLKVIAEEVVFGTFIVKAGTIIGVNPESNQINLKDLGTNKPLTVTLTADSQMKSMPALPRYGPRYARSAARRQR